MSGDEHKISHLNGLNGQMEGNIAQENTFATRNKTYRLDHDDVHATPGARVDDPILLKQKKTLNQSSHSLSDIPNGQDQIPAVGGRHNHFEPISDYQVDENAAPTTMHELQDKTCALVDGVSDHPLPRSTVTHDDLESSTSISNHSNPTTAMLATLQEQTYPILGASEELTAPPFHRTLNHQATFPIIQTKDSNNSSIKATLRDQAYGLTRGPVEALKKELNGDRHELVSKVPEVRGAVQEVYHVGSDTEMVRDIGWHKANADVPDPLIGGYTNGDLFEFIRRFNKDVFDVKAMPIENASGLDLNDSWAQDHTRDKLTLHLQRLYLSVVLGTASFGKQISRLRSWKENYRTSIFCGIYFTAWIFDLLISLALGALILVVSSVQARNALFPPAPRALVSIRTGGIQKPQAGLLGTNDTLTGAPEKQPHEAIEEEAANFVNNFRHNIQKALGMHNRKQEDGDGDPVEGNVPKPIKKVIQAVQSAGSAPGHVIESTNQTEQPMEEMIWAGVNPEAICKIFDIAPHLIGELADNWEIFAKVAGFVIGFVIFGDPILTPAIAWLKRKIPNYMELAQPKKSVSSVLSSTILISTSNVLRGIPTNIQIAITLLRIGEACKTPIPPVPTSNPDDTDHQNTIDVERIPVGATQPDVLDATLHSVAEKTGSDDNEEKPDHKHLSKIIRFFKGNAKSVVKTKLVIDHARAATGSQKAKGHLGVLPKTKSIVYAGPSVYQCRYEGEHGWAVITESTRPSLLFTRNDPRLMSSKKLTPLFEIAIRDMKRLKRATAFVSSAVEAIATSSSDQKLLAGLEIQDHEEKTRRLTAIPERDELFNRLIAIGNQRWENM
ncbi:unnamed protein product [Penicillium pancosmium]